MNDVLVRIKRAIIDRRFVFSEKAAIELFESGLTERDALESILNAVAIYKTIRSRKGSVGWKPSKLYVIQSTNLDGLAIYTKGTFKMLDGQETFYFLISSKRAL